MMGPDTKEKQMAKKTIRFQGGPVDGQTDDVELEDGRVPVERRVARADGVHSYELRAGVDADGADTGERVYVHKGVV